MPISVLILLPDFHSEGMHLPAHDLGLPFGTGTNSLSPQASPAGQKRTAETVLLVSLDVFASPALGAGREVKVPHPGPEGQMVVVAPRVGERPHPHLVDHVSPRVTLDLFQVTGVVAHQRQTRAQNTGAAM